MLEIEKILDRWCDERLGDLTHEELTEFHEHVLEAETTELYNYFFKNMRNTINSKWLEEVLKVNYNRNKDMS